jgi:hypothetical protein
MSKYKIIRNSAKCLLCNDEIESKHRHDFKYCKCGNISVDGGLDYIKRGAMHFDAYQDTSITEDLENG